MGAWARFWGTSVLWLETVTTSPAPPLQMGWNSSICLQGIWVNRETWG